METTNHFKYNIIEIANKIEGQRNKSKHQLPYNVFTMWGMSENDHTKFDSLSEPFGCYHSIQSTI